MSNKNLDERGELIICSRCKFYEYRWNYNTFHPYKSFCNAFTPAVGCNAIMYGWPTTKTYMSLEDIPTPKCPGFIKRRTEANDY